MENISLIRRYQVLALRNQLDIWAHSIEEIPIILARDFPDIKEYKIFPADHLPPQLDLYDYNDILTACKGDEEKTCAVAWYCERKGLI